MRRPHRLRIPWPVWGLIPDGNQHTILTSTTQFLSPNYRTLGVHMSSVTASSYTAHDCPARETERDPLEPARLLRRVAKSV